MILWRSGVETLVAIISYSGNLEKIFKGFCKEAGLSCESLGYAKHRLNCIPKVLSYYIVFRIPLLRTCQYILDTRETTSDAYNAALNYGNMCADEFLLIGMAADATDDALCLLRLWDYDNPG